MGKAILRLVKFIKEEIIGSENTFLAWAVLAATGAIVGMGFYLNSPDISFLGIAGSRESIVNFEYPVEIRRVHVITGQRVKRGDLLVELDQSDLHVRIRALNAQILRLKAEKSVRDQMNNAVGNAGAGLSSDPLLVEIRQLEEEMGFLERQKMNLYVFAEIDGIVGSINFRRGERASAFSPIITISPDTPTFVQGFVNERLRSSVRLGSVVEVRSINNPDIVISGKVMSVGSRFVEIPVRLGSVGHGGASSGLWGREVQVEIAEGSAVLLGEKVVINPVHDFLEGWIARFLPNYVAQAVNEGADTRKDPEIRSIRLPVALAGVMNLEASGAIYLPSLSKYLVVSDDTDAKNSPWLFLVGEDGEIDERPLTIPGLHAIRDLESISQEGEFIYVLSSLQAKDSGELNPLKSNFLRLKRETLEITDARSINFAEMLRKAIRKSDVKDIRGIYRQENDKLEIEAHAVKNGDLYLGLRSAGNGDPYTVMILRIANVAKLFDGTEATPRLEMWKRIELPATKKGTHRISDLTFVGDSVFFTTTRKGEPGGAFWMLSNDGIHPRLVQEYEIDRPEGVAFNSAREHFFITFDNKDRGSSFSIIPKSAIPNR